VHTPSAILCMAILAIITKLNFSSSIDPIATAIPSHMLWNPILAASNSESFFVESLSQPLFLKSKSIKYIIKDPIIKPYIQLLSKPYSRLCGIRSKKDMEIIIPAENANRCAIIFGLGFFIMPKKEPIIGDIKDIINVVDNKFPIGPPYLIN